VYDDHPGDHQDAQVVDPQLATPSVGAGGGLKGSSRLGKLTRHVLATTDVLNGGAIRKAALSDRAGVGGQTFGPRRLSGCASSLTNQRRRNAQQFD
jgi:hypothetical protein